jgi:dTDP-4-amino-4,6-dideoxygalactose transaminase
MIPLVDLKEQHRRIQPGLDEAINRVIDSSRFIMGPEVEAFESQLAIELGLPYAVGVASGTAALSLSLRCLEIGPGDEVITTTNSFMATAEAILHAGAKPVFVDIDPATYNIDTDKVAAAITLRTRAIMPVHLYGQPADMPALAGLAARHRLMLVEDAAQAHGATVCDEPVGWRSEAACLSFYPGKNLGAFGDAGAILTRNRSLAERLRKLRDHGRSQKYVHDLVGYGERLDALQAAVLGVKLPHLSTWNESRRRLAERYRQILAGLPLTMPTEASGRGHVYHLFVVRARSREERDGLRAYLAEHDIATGIHYPVPLHLQPALTYLDYQRGNFPVAEQVADTVLSLPMYPELSAGQQDEVAAAIHHYFSG